MDGMYPVSIPFDGSAVNFTVVSNYENLDFGIVACRKSMPHVQRLIDYMEDALVELEEAAGISTPAAKRKRSTRSAPKRKTAARGKRKTATKRAARKKA